MNYRQILREYSHEKTLERFREPLNKALTAKREGAGLRSLGFYDLGTDDAGTAVLLFFEKMDPTKKKAYVLLMVKWFLDGSMKLLEDAAKLKPVIQNFDKFRNTLTGVDLRTMSFDDFLDLGDELAKKISNSEAGRAEEEYFYNDGQAIKFYDGPDMKIIKPVTVAAAKYFGRGTRWCTAADEDNMFTQYAQQGEIYCILFKGENRRWQFHFESEQFMDEKDQDLDQTMPLFGKVMEHFQHEIENRLWPDMKVGQPMPVTALKFLLDPPHELLMDIVDEDGLSIEFVRDDLRTDDIWFAALTSNWEALQFAINPPENIALFAIKKNPMAIIYTGSPTVAEQVLAVTINPEIVVAIEQKMNKRVYPEAALIAVKSAGTLIMYCGVQPASVQIVAFNEDPRAMQYMEGQTPELIDYAIEKSPRNIIYVKKHLLTDEMKLKALRLDKSVINFIHKPTPEMLALGGRA
jgi:hypothetical protein